MAFRPARLIWIHPCRLKLLVLRRLLGLYVDRLLPIAAIGRAVHPIGAAISRTQGRVEAAISCTCRRSPRRSLGCLCKYTSCTLNSWFSSLSVLARSCGSRAPSTRHLVVACLPCPTPTCLLLGPAGWYNGRHLPALVLFLYDKCDTRPRPQSTGPVSVATSERRQMWAAFFDAANPVFPLIQRGNTREGQTKKLSPSGLRSPGAG